MLIGAGATVLGNITVGKVCTTMYYSITNPQFRLSWCPFTSTSTQSFSSPDYPDRRGPKSQPAVWC